MGIIPNPWAPSSTDSHAIPTARVRVLQDARTGYRMAIGSGDVKPIAWLASRLQRTSNVTIARRRPTTFSAIAAPMPTAPVRAPFPGIGVPLPLGDAPAPEFVTPVGRLRRCTFRRIDRVEALPGRGSRSEYEVMCLYGSGDEPLGLGDISQAGPICDACTAAGIFRPDEA